jgi:hypothetical protein
MIHVPQLAGRGVCFGQKGTGNGYHTTTNSVHWQSADAPQRRRWCGILQLSSAHIVMLEMDDIRAEDEAPEMCATRMQSQQCAACQ